eukprot:gene15963-21662_t
MFRQVRLFSSVLIASTISGGSPVLCDSSPSTTGINKYIDHTVLKPTCLSSDISKLCDEAKKFQFAAVCVPPNFISASKQLLAGSNVKVATVVGFPFGYSSISAKKAEIIDALQDGADELDIVINVSAIKNNDWDYLQKEISTLLPLIRQANKIVKIIIESGVLSDEEIILCCRLYGKEGIDYLKTSTGYADKGASVHAVELFRNNLPSSVQIKASGGIRDYITAKQMIDAGATRIGCSSGIAIMGGAPSTDKGVY